jgi:hypothetical protein
MPRNLHCGCLCHGSNGNRIGDEYFACKNCYAANHMHNLPKVVPQQRTKPAGKPRKPRPTAPTGTIEAVAAAVATETPKLDRTKPLYDRSKKIEQNV